MSIAILLNKTICEPKTCGSIKDAFFLKISNKVKMINFKLFVLENLFRKFK